MDGVCCGQTSLREPWGITRLASFPRSLGISYHVAGLGVLPSFVGVGSEGQGFCPEVFLRDVGAESRPHFHGKAWKSELLSGQV